MPHGVHSGADLPFSNWLYVHTALVWATLRVVEPRFCNTYYSANQQTTAWMIERGGVQFRAGNIEVSAGEGEWLFPGLGMGWQVFLPETKLLSVKFSAEWPTGKTLFDHQIPILLSKANGLTRAAKLLSGLVRATSGRDGYFLLDQSTADVTSYFEIRLAFESWLLAYVKTMVDLGQSPSVMTQADPRVLHAARLIDAHPPSSQLSEAEIAAKVGLSVSQLNRLFSRDLDSSPSKYKERRQFEKAISLLNASHCSIKEVASELGFRSLPHFSTWFRRLKGLSPRLYRQRISREVSY